MTRQSTVPSCRMARRPRGASSILVLMVLLLLVFLAVLAFVTTGANLRLAKKNAETIQSWYRMDAAGEQAAAKILHALRYADEQTQAWLDGNGFLQPGQEVLPESIRQQIRDRWIQLVTDDERQVFREAIAAPVGTMFAEQAVRRLSLPGVEVVPADPQILFPAGALNVPDAADVADTQEVTDTTEEVTDVPAAADTALFFRLRMEDPEQMSAGSLQAVLVYLPPESPGQQSHVQVLSWRLVQEPFAYTNGITLWEGIVE